jgi:hypothetical protein
VPLLALSVPLLAVAARLIMASQLALA